MRHHAKHLWGFVRNFRVAFGLGLLVVANCAPNTSHDQSASKGHNNAPKRIVSLDYCADQFVLKLADRSKIVALSPEATRDFSYLRQQAVGLFGVRPSAEEVLALKPDLIVRSYGGEPHSVAFFERAGIKVHQIGWGGDFEAVRTNVRDAAAAMGQTSRGEAVIKDFDKRLENLVPAEGVSTLYVTSGGVTTGKGSLIDLMMTHAGLTNFQIQPGWNPLPLERLATTRPDMLATAFFDDSALARDYWSSARHPIIREALSNIPVAALDGATTACGGWFIMDAIEALAKQGNAVAAASRPKPLIARPTHKDGL